MSKTDMTKPTPKTRQRKEIKPIITHTMADGSVRNSVRGYPCAVNKYAETTYRILADLIRQQG